MTAKQTPDVRPLVKDRRLRGYALVVEGAPVAYVRTTRTRSARSARAIALSAARMSTWDGMPVVHAWWSAETYRVERRRVTILATGRL